MKYLKSEYRDLSLSEAKEIMVNLLDLFVSFCETFNLKYSLTAGTLLGAIRHKGFIPWDDDLDVMMPREDYVIFTKKFPKWAKNKNIRLVGPRTPGFYMLFSKIIASNTLVIQDDRNIKIGVWIDVFPVDFVKKEPYESYESMITYSKQFYYLGDHNFFIHLKDKKFFPKIVSILRNGKRAISRLIKKRFYLYKHFQFIRKHKGTKSMCFYSPSVIKIWFDISNVTFNELTSSRFEKNNYKIIQNWDEYLSVHYGNYLVIPPVNERIVHKCQIRKIKV